MPATGLEKRRHFYWLDLLRFLAAFEVMAGHTRGFLFVDYGSLPAAQHTPLTFALFSITRIGDEAVLMFFVLSGFLVGGKTIQKLKEGTFNLQSYIIDRTVRIMLPLISALLLIICINSIMHVKNDSVVLFGNLFSLQGIAVDPASPPFWSLSYEVWFYIIMGAIACFFTTTSLQQRVVAFLILLVSFAVFTKLQFVYLAIWFIGAFAYLLVPQKKNRYLFMLTAVTFVAALIPLQMTLASKSAVTAGWQKYLNRDFLQIGFALVFAMLIVQAIQYVPRTRFGQRLDKLGTRLANFSYTLYLAHYPPLGLLMYWGYPKSSSLGLRSVAGYALILALLVAYSYAVYWLFEKRTSTVKRFLHNLANRHVARAPSAVTTS
jgi:peptidoglycan/LPS O-acetylase OafA/YrhL